mgnify:FL=1
MADKIWIGGSTSGANSLNVAANWSPSGVPSGSDNIYFTHRSTSSALHDLATLATVSGELHIEAGYTQFIGSSTGPNYMEMAPSATFINAVQPCHIDVKGSTGVVHIENSGTGTLATAGVNLKGTAIGRINMMDGTVGLALNPGETSTVAEIEMLSRGKLMLGGGVTWTNASINGGTLTAVSGTTSTVVNLFGGTFSAAEDCKLKDLNTNDGTAFLGGTGNVKNVTMRGGTVNTLFSGQPRTVTNLKMYQGEFLYDPTVLTVTNHLDADTPIALRVSLQ